MRLPCRLSVTSQSAATCTASSGTRGRSGTGRSGSRTAAKSARRSGRNLTPALREQLTLARADRDPRPTDYVVATATGAKHNPSNLRRDVLAKAVEAANKKLAEQGIAPIGGITFHSLRRTYASLRCACGDDIRYAADQLGHEDPRFTLRVYAQATKRRDRLAGPHLKAFDQALEWARFAASADVSADAAILSAQVTTGVS